MSCADPDEPCRVPNAFVSDPPLELPGSDEANDAATEDGAIVVEPGDRLPGIPRHSFKAGVRQGITRAWDVTLETIVASSRVFVGDEGNDQPELDGYGVVNLRTAYRFDAGVELFARIDNLFDARYATAGVLAELKVYLREVPDASDPRFVGPGAPRRGRQEFHPWPSVRTRSRQRTSARSGAASACGSRSRRTTAGGAGGC